MVETILSPTQLLLTVVNTDASGYSSLLCHVDAAKHWKFKPHRIETLRLQTASAPQVVGLRNWTEAVGDRLVPVVGAEVSADGLSLSQIQLSDQLVARFFVADVVWH
jgi:hypothetical protein